MLTSDGPRRRAVKIGLADRTSAQVLSGLAVGDQVIVGAACRPTATTRTGRRAAAARAACSGSACDAAQTEAGAGAAGARRRQQGLPQRRRRDPGPRLRLAGDPRRRVRGHHGPVGVGQVDADEHHRLPRPAEPRQLPGRRARRGEPVGRRAGGAAPRHLRLRVPALQSAGHGDGGRERRDPRDLCRPLLARPHGARAGAAAASRPRRPRRSSPRRAVGRAAAARVDRARADERCQGHSRRRADRRARQPERRGGAGAAARAACRRPHDRADHARRGRRRPCRPAHPDSRRPHRRGQRRADPSGAGAEVRST